jgi:hypothetical protein
VQRGALRRAPSSGGAATGNVRAASIGAAAGAAASTLTGKIVQENQAAGYGPPPPGGYPFARWAGRSGFYYSPYTGRIYDLRGVQPGGLTRDADTGRPFRQAVEGEPRCGLSSFSALAPGAYRPALSLRLSC